MSNCLNVSAFVLEIYALDFSVNPSYTTNESDDNEGSTKKKNQLKVSEKLLALAEKA